MGNQKRLNVIDVSNQITPPLGRGVGRSLMGIGYSVLGVGSWELGIGRWVMGISDDRKKSVYFRYDFYGLKLLL